MLLRSCRARFASLLLALLALIPFSKALEVHLDQPVGALKRKLGGVSLGGGAHTFMKPEKMTPLQGLPMPLVRLEAVPGSFHHLYDPETKTYDWSELDREIEAIQKSGAEIILNLFYTPKWLSGDPEGTKGPYCFAQPRDLAAWGQLVEDIVRHVNLEKKYGITYWEVWNEPSGNHFWRGWHPGGKSFWPFFGATYQAIKKADPTAKVGGLGDNAFYNVHYDNLFANAERYGYKVDFLTAHWYGQWQAGAWQKPDMYRTLSEQLRAKYEKAFGNEPEIFYSEWNLHAENPQFQMPQQAAFMAQALTHMQAAPVTGAMFFRIEDYRPRMSMLSRANEAQAPSRVLQMFSMLEPSVVAVDGLPEGVQVLATTSKGGGQSAILVSRYDFAEKAETKTVSLSLTGLPEGKLNVQTWSITPTNADGKGLLGKPETEMQKEAKDGKLTLDLAMPPFSVFLVKAQPIE